MPKNVVEERPLDLNAVIKNCACNTRIKGAPCLWHYGLEKLRGNIK